MSEQLTFDLPARPALGRDDFFVSPSNETALATVDNWRHWPLGKLLIAGSAGAGKTHLVRVWATDSGALVLLARDLPDCDIAAVVNNNIRIAIEDIETIAGNSDAERALFHLHNLVLAEGGRLLFSAPDVLPRFDLPDLQSRIEGTPQARLSPPDDALLGAVLVKLFADRQIAVSANVVSYISRRMERSLESAVHLVGELDAAALAQNRPITRDLARAVLDKFSQVGS